MAVFTFDLFGALEKWIEFRRINEWVKLCLSLFCSFWLSGAFVCGAGLTAHRPTMEAIGEGLISGAVMATMVWRRSDLTKGLILALPAAEAKAELETDSQIIRRS